MVTRLRDGGETRVRAWRQVHRELAAVRALPRRSSLRHVGMMPSRLVAASAALHRLERVRHLLDWPAVVTLFVDLVDDPADDVVRWLLEPLEPVA